MSGLQPVRLQIKSAVEILGLVAPILCLFDCIVLPVLPALLPLVGVHHIIHGISDQLLTLIVLTLCCPAILPGFFKHRNPRILIMFGVAAGLMLFINMISTGLDQLLHTALTLVSSGLLIKANLDNRKLLACSCVSIKRTAQGKRF
jgi:MerC mercury resistance protein